MNVSRNLRRASLRVVNFGGLGLEDHVRLDDMEDERMAKQEDEEEEEDAADDEALPDLSKTLPIRGRTLGCLGPTSTLRLAMYRFLVYP